MFHIISLLLGFTLLSSGIAVSDLDGKQSKTESVSINISTVVKANLPPDQNKLNNFLEYASKKEQEIQTKQEEEKIEKEQEQAKVAEEKRKEEERIQIAAKKKAEQDAIAKANARKIQTATPVNNVVVSGPVSDIIRHWASVYGIDAEKAIRIGQCESELNPSSASSNGLYGGVFQQSIPYWPNRAANAGMAGANIFDANANVKVSIQMMATQGFHHWPSCSSR